MYSKDAILLRLNKETQVRALNEQGFSEVTMDTPLMEIAEYIKWTGGLRDLRIACVKPADGTVYYFSGEEWSALSANAKSNYEKIGVCIRARKRMFIIAPEDCVSETGGTTFKFGLRGTDLKGVKNYGANSSGLYDITTGLEDTKAAVEQGAGLTDSEGTVGAPAAEAAWSYKASAHDTNQWFLPSVAELRLIAEYKTEIHAFLDKYFAGSGKFQNNWYWSSTEYDSALQWTVTMLYGHSISYTRNGTYRVRPVSLSSFRVVSSAD